MTTEQKITRVQTLLGNEAEVDSSTVTEYLSIAEEDIIQARFPFKIPEHYTLEPQFEGIQCQLAARYIARRGGLGETDHNENGINRSWYSSDDREILAKVTPYAKVVG